MKNFKPITKRILAYIIDIFVISSIAQIISTSSLFTTQNNNYQNKIHEYEEKYMENYDYSQLLEENYKDKIITEEEYNKLLDSKIYEDILISKYEDHEITEEEYKEIEDNF